jgi:parvulin-like peptidyl-prolyl isomerase
LSLRSLLAVLASAVLFGACGTASPDVAATVDGDEIGLAELETLVSAQIAGAGLPDGRASPEQYEEVAQLQRDVLSQLIQDRVIVEAAADLDVEVPDEEVEAQLEDLAAQFGGTEALQEELDRRGLSEEELREQITAFVRRERLAQHFVDVAEIDDEEVEEVYEARLDDRYRIARASHILVETAEEAEEVLAELEAGEDFETLAQERSIDEFSATRGGELGENPRGAYVEPFDDALWAAEEGEIVGPVETEFGYHVIRVEEFREQRLPEVADEIREELRTQAGQVELEAWMADALAQAEVEVNPRLGRWAAEAGQVVATDPLERRPPIDDEPVGTEDAPELEPTGD